jgi:hypothetical protein
MVAGSQGQAVGDLSTRWTNLTLVGGVEGLDDFLLAIKKMDTQFVEQHQTLTPLEIETKLKRELSSQNCKEAWDMRKNIILQSTVNNRTVPEGLALVDMMITIRTQMATAEGKYTSNKVRQADRRDGLNTIAGQASQKAGKVRQMECRFFKNGKCKKGDACDFKHTVQEDDSQTSEDHPDNKPKKFDRELPTCFHCGETGHTKPGCPRKEMTQEKAAEAAIQKIKTTMQKGQKGALANVETKEEQHVEQHEATQEANKLNNITTAQNVKSQQDSLSRREQAIEYLKSKEGKALLNVLTDGDNYNSLFTIRIKLPETTYKRMNDITQSGVTVTGGGPGTSKRALSDGACTTSITNSKEGAKESKQVVVLIELPNGRTVECNEMLLKEMPCFLNDEQVGSRELWMIYWPACPIDIFAEGELCRGGRAARDIDDPNLEKFID